MKQIRLVIFIIMAGLSGCASIPFEAVSYMPVLDIDPVSVRNDFAHSMPQQFEILSSVVFRYKWHSFASLGYTSADVPEETFDLTGLNQMGITLFNVSGVKGEINSRFAIDEFTKQGDFKKVVADVVTNVYFQNVPSADAQWKKTKHEIIFTQPEENGFLEYVFAGTNNRLIEKRYKEHNRTVWAIRYYEYTEYKNAVYPYGIVFKHHRYGYTITLSVKEIHT